MPGTAVPPAGATEVRAHPLARVPRTDDGRLDLDAIATALAPADLLETAADGTGWSYVVPTRGARLVDDGERTELRHPGGEVETLGRDPFAAVDAWCDRHGVRPDRPVDGDLPPFTGGLVGAFGYDLARRVERLPVLAAADRPTLDLSLRVAELVVAVAPTRDHALLLVRPLGTDVGELTRRADEVESRLTDVARPGRRPPAPAPPAPRPVSTSLPRTAYLTAVERALAHIAAGDCFQVNLTQRLSARWEASTADLYRRLRDASPAPHGALLPDIGVASISPETFLAVTGRDVVVRPIKGTRPRDADPDLDAAHADDLATSAKDRAENVMVVDLERNDLGRVCIPGSVRVPRLCEVEAHPTVWHLVSDVVGRLRDGTGYGELLRATFPCGSITGAPKVRAMEIIETLEPVRRGWYCGAVGFLAPGAASLSVAIRTATLHPDGTVDHGAGGGIVADSDPAAEHAESLDKAAAFLRAVAGHVAG
jgi:para-aminobenzoate synthetase component I